MPAATDNNGTGNVLAGIDNRQGKQTKRGDVMNMQQIRETTAIVRRAGSRLWERTRVGAAVFGYMMLGLSPAMADDLDIYTKNVAGGSGGAPVILFQIDNSGSMMWRLSATGSTSASNLMDQRLYRMVDIAMGQASGMPGTYKLGLTTYVGNYSGQLNVEAKPLREVFASDAESSGSSTFFVVDENDDVQHVRTSSGTNAARGTRTLSLGAVFDRALEAKTALNKSSSNTGLKWPAAGYATTDDFPVLATGSAGTAYGLYTGYFGNTVIWYRHGGSTSQQGFKITAATQNTYMVLTDEEGNLLDATSTISTARSGSTTQCSSTYVAATAPDNACISARLTKNTWYRIVIGTDTAGVAGTFTLTLANGSAANSIFRETRPPVAPSRVGLRFKRLDIPAGATISKAYLQFQSVEARSDALDLRVGIDNDVAPDALTETDLFATARSINWGAASSVPAWPNDAPATPNDALDSTAQLDVTNILQNHVLQSDWCGGDAVFLVETGSVPTASSGGGGRVVRAYDGLWQADPDRAASLVVEWTGGAAAGCTERELTLAVENSSDDVHQSSTGVITYDGVSLPVGKNNAIGLRFPLVPLPSGVVVKEAYLKVTAYAAAGSQPLKIEAVDEGVAGVFGGDAFALDALPKVGAGGSSVSWTTSASAAGAVLTSPDLAPLLQPLLDRSDWNYDGAVALVLRGDTSATGTIPIRAWERHVSGDASSSVDRTDYGRFAARLVLKVAHSEAIPVQQSHRYRLYNAFNRVPADYNTPIVGAYLESAEYMLGRGSDAFGKVYTQPALADGGCATNGIVVLTDGEENSSYSGAQATAAQAIIADWKNASGVIPTCKFDTGSNKWNCMYNMMAAMHHESQGLTAADGKKYKIRTDAIGFGPEAASSSGLGGTAGKGGGNYYSAANSAQLIKAFKDIVVNVSVSTASVAAPGVAVNALNKFEHLDELYYSLFKPESNVGWRGNLKRYRLKDGVIVDMAGEPAISTSTGLFASETQSWWSDEIDAGNALLGGAAGQVTVPTTRRMYTYMGPYGTSLNVPLSPGVGPDRDGSGAEIVHPDNTNLTATSLGLTALTEYAGWTTEQKAARRVEVIEFLRGGSDSAPRKKFGAMPHSAPSLVTYGNDGANGINTLFVSDNEGVLHMIDTGEVSDDDLAINQANTGGRELFAFVAREALPGTADLWQASKKVPANPYIYGLDGTWVPWKYDVDLDGTVEPADGDKVYIYGGMRRGGKNYYALDVTSMRRDVSDPSPVLKWVIQGGATGTAYANMGQSWSEPSPRWIRWNGVRRRVVFFSGGYDPVNHDNKPTFTSGDQLGRQVYMVDAETGELMWWASSQTTASTVVSDMRYSITAAPVTLDRNGNGSVDGFYILDLAGQLFRFDIDEGATSATTFIRGNTPTLVAKLGATASGADSTLDNRRFYDSPAVAFVRSGSGGDLMLAMASGYREFPGSTATREKVIFIRDVGAWNMVPPPRATALTVADLAELPETGELTAAAQALPGWHMDLERTVGEKGLGSPVFFNFALLFSTFVPKGVITDLDCAPDIGYSRLYAMNALTGAGIVNDELDNASENQRYIDQAMPGLGSTVQMLYMDGQLTILSGTLAIATDNSTGTGLEDDSSDLLDPAIFGNVRRTQWFEINQ